jgi:hypothetical protein
MKMFSAARKRITKGKGTALRSEFLFRQGDCRNKGHNPEKVSWVRALVSVLLARKLSTIEEQRQYQSCSFRRGDYKNEATTPKICTGFIVNY